MSPAMSWSISREFTRMELMNGQDIGSTLVRKFFERGAYADGSSHPATVEAAVERGTPFETFVQVNQAVQAAGSLIGALGSNWEQIHVTLSGHANPGNAAERGMAADGIHVSVAVAKYLSADVEDGGPEQLTLTPVPDAS